MDCVSRLQESRIIFSETNPIDEFTEVFHQLFTYKYHQKYPGAENLKIKIREI